jgi:CHAT domain-containing protein
LQAYGGELLDNLVPPDLQEVLWEHRERLGSIQVFSEEPFIPWEIVHLKPRNGPVSNDRTWFLGELGLVRWLHNTMLPPEILRARKDKAFHLVPVYKDEGYALPQAQMEIPFLEAKFSARACGVDLPGIHALLREPNKFDLLHFAGHGDAELSNISSSSLLLSAEPDLSTQTGVKTTTLNARIVSQIMSLPQPGPDPTRPIVVLNACRAGRIGWTLTRIGGFAEAFVSRGAGLFIGAHWSVGDAPARTFSEAFYSALLAGRTVSEAAKAGRRAAREAGDATWLAYTVYGHPHAVLVRK